MRTDRQKRQTLTVAIRCFSNMPDKNLFLNAIRYPQKNGDSVVGVVTRPWARWSGVRIPKGANVYLFSKIIHRNSGVYPASCSMCTGVLFRKKSGVLSWLFASTRTEVKKVWSYTSILPERFHAVDRDNFHTIYVHIILLHYVTRYPDWNILWFSLRFYSSVTSGKYPHKSLPTHNICQVFTCSVQEEKEKLTFNFYLRFWKLYLILYK